MLHCPRCFRELDTAMPNQFCPRCGLPNATVAAADVRPLDVNVGDRSYCVGTWLSAGSITNVYRCLPGTSLGHRSAVFKIARDAISNSFLISEATVLRKLEAADPAGRFTPFFPHVLESFAMTGINAEPARQANVLGHHSAITSVDDLYSFEDVRNVIPGGLESRDVAWIWRRLLTVLDFAHRSDVVHGSVFPMHVMIDPADHKLLLIDWCASMPSSVTTPLPALLAGQYQRWTWREGLPLTYSPASDLKMAARSIVYLLGADNGDPISLAPTVEPAIRSHLRRSVNAPPPAGQLLGEFDALIEALWGPRQFRPLTLPSKRGR